MDTTWVRKAPAGSVSGKRMRSIGLVAVAACAGAALCLVVRIYFLVEFFAVFLNAGLIGLGVLVGLFCYRRLPERFEKWARVASAVMLASAVTLSLMYLTRSWHMVHDLRMYL